MTCLISQNTIDYKSNMGVSCKRQEPVYILCEYLGSPLVLLVRSMLLIILVFCVVYCIFFVCLRPVSCVPSVATVSRFSILDCPLGFL